MAAAGGAPGCRAAGGSDDQVTGVQRPGQDFELLLPDDPALEHELLDLTERQREAEYSHTQWEITSTGYRWPLYDGDALPTDDTPPTTINPKIIPPAQPT